MSKFAKLTNFFTLTSARTEKVPGDGEISAAEPSCSSSSEPQLGGASVGVSANDDKQTPKDRNKGRSSVSETTFVKWCKEFKWLYKKEGKGESEVMVCKICEKFGRQVMAVKVSSHAGMSTLFIEGCPVFKHENLVRHDKSIIHQKSVILAAVAENPKEAPIVKTTAKLNEHEFEKMECLFNTAYYIAENNKPFTDFPELCNLQKKNHVELGNTYLSNKQCSLFISCIDKDIFDTTIKEFSSCDYFAIMSDASTDVSVTESEIMYATFLKNGNVKTIFLDLLELDNGKAETVFTEMSSFLSKNFNDWKKKLVSVCFDGTNVNFGEYKGIAVRFEKECPGIIKIHCLGHRLELAFKDSVKDHKMFEKSMKLYKGIYKVYSKSPKLLNQLKSMADILEEEVIRYVSVIEIRWVANKQRAFKAFCQNFVTTVSHLENFYENPDPEVKNDSAKKAKIKGYLKLLKDPNLLAFMFFMQDVLDILVNLSLVLQKDNIFVYSAKNCVLTTREKLELMMNSPEPSNSKHLAEFYKYFDEEKMMFKTIQLSKSTSTLTVPLQLQKNKKTLIDNLVECLDTRFEDLKTNLVLKNLHVFDHLNFPSDPDKFLTHGGSDFIELVENLPHNVLDSIDLESAQDEFQNFKFWLKRQAKDNINASLRDLHSRFLSESHALNTHPNLCKILGFLKIILVSTAVCERGFSTMNNIKTDKRNRLEIKKVSELMDIKLNGPGINNFCANNSISVWWNTPSHAATPLSSRVTVTAAQNLGRKRPCVND